MKKEKKRRDVIGWILLILGIIVFAMIVFAFIKTIWGF